MGEMRTWSGFTAGILWIRVVWALNYSDAAPVQDSGQWVSMPMLMRT